MFLFSGLRAIIGVHEAFLILDTEIWNSDCNLYFIWADIFCFHTILWPLIISPFKPWASLSFDFCVSSHSTSWLQYIVYSMMKTVFCEHRRLWKRGVCSIQWELSNIWRNVQIVDHLALLQKFSVFLWMKATVLSVWYLYTHWKRECCGWTHSLLKTNIFDFNVIFVITEVYIFIQIFGLYSGPVTDCTFCGECILRISSAKSPPASLRSRFSWHLLNGPGIQYVSLGAFQPGW